MMMKEEEGERSFLMFFREKKAKYYHFSKTGIPVITEGCKIFSR
jgi:hypothetical protein